MDVIVSKGQPFAACPACHARRPTFADACETVIAIHAGNWKPGGRTKESWRATLRDYALPRLGEMAVDAIAGAVSPGRAAAKRRRRVCGLTRWRQWRFRNSPMLRPAPVARLLSTAAKKSPPARESGSAATGAGDAVRNSSVRTCTIFERSHVPLHKKHLHRYVNEATFRLNEANCKVHTLDRLSAFADRAFRHRITYRTLTT